jgi:hypothetical protein
MCPETFNLWVIAERIPRRHQQQFSITGDCFVSPHVLPHRLTVNHYRDFLIHDLPKYMAVRARIWYMHDGVPAYFSRAVQYVLSNTCHDDGQVQEDTLHVLHARQKWILWNFTCGGHLKTLVSADLLTMRRHFTIAFCMPVRLPATAPTSLHGCGCPWWDVSRRALTLMEDILNSHFKRTFSAITHKWNVSGHMLTWAFFLFIWNSAPKICPNLSATSCIDPAPVFYITYSLFDLKTKGRLHVSFYPCLCVTIAVREPWWRLSKCTCASYLQVTDPYSLQECNNHNNRVRCFRRHMWHVRWWKPQTSSVSNKYQPC